MANLNIVTARLPTGEIVRVSIPDGKEVVLVRGRDGKTYAVRKKATQNATPERTRERKSAWKMPEPPRGHQVQPPSHGPERMAGDMTLPNPLAEQRKKNLEIARESSKTRSNKGSKIYSAAKRSGGTKGTRERDTSELGHHTTETVSQFSDKLKLPVTVVLEQLVKAGVIKWGADDALAEHDKAKLLEYLRRSHSRRLNIDSTRAKEQEATGVQNTASIALLQANRTAQQPARTEPKVVSAIDYHWPSRFEHGPYQHQIKTTEFLVQHERAFCLNDMGSGKTASVLWAYDYLRQKGIVKRMLVVSPLSTLMRTWGDEISKNFKLRFMVLTGTGEERRKKLRELADIYIINHDGLKVAGMVEAINLRNDIELIVVDEIAQAARSASTDRWKALAKIVRHELPSGLQRRAYGLTGTPTPNNPADAWAQCRLLVPHNVPPYYNAFKAMTMRQVGYQQWAPKREANQIVVRAMQPSIRYRREECIDLPPVTYQTREVELSSEQKRLYREMLITLRAELENGEITAANELVKANKLLQIASGAAYQSNGQTAFITPVNRLEVTEEIISESSGSVIVFVPFRGALEAVANYLEKKGIAVGVIHGGVSTGERDRIFKAFQDEGRIRVLVAQPASMSHGLNLTAANTIIWFGPVHSNDTYQQSCARITRPGQVRKQLIVHIQGCPAEERVYTRLRQKGKLQGVLLELLRELRADLVTS